MSVLESGLGGNAGFGENSFKTTGVDEPSAYGTYDDCAVRIDLTSVFGENGIEFFGENYTEVWVNSNGLLTFEGPNTSYQPEGLSGLDQPAIAPFWSDVDIDKGGDIYWDVDPDSGKIVITWHDVAGYNAGAATNTFQVVLSNEGDDKFNVEFNYEDIGWADGGFGAATAGLTDGGIEDLDVPGSGDPDAILSWDGDGSDDDEDATILIEISGGRPKLEVLGSDSDDTLVEGVGGVAGGVITKAGDLIDAGDGNDTVDGGAGSDTIDGGDGDDVISGGSAEAIEWTAVGNNGDVTGDGLSNYFSFSAGAGDSATIRLNDSAFRVSGDNEADFVRIETTNETGRLTLSDFDPGTDKIVLQEDFTEISHSPSLLWDDVTITYANGNTQSFRIYADDDIGDAADLFTTEEPINLEDDDLLDGGEGADTFLVGFGFGADTIIGGGDGSGADQDVDRIDISVGTVGVSVAYETSGAGKLTDGFDTLTFEQIEALNLTNLDDIVDATADSVGVEVTAGDGDDTVLGGAGDDVFEGGEGADRLIGGEGNDLISGGAGDDFLKTGLGQDTLEGGEGADTLMNAAGDDSLVGGAGDDLIVATQGVDTLEGGDGNDTLMGGTDGDSVDGGADNDLILGDLAGVDFNTTGTDGVGVASGITDFPSTELSFEITFASDDTSGFPTLVSYATADSADAFQVNAVSGTIRVTIDDVTIDTGVSEASVFDGNLHSLGVTWDSSSGALEVYVDGTSQFSGTFQTGASIGGPGTLVLGQDADTPDGGFDGGQVFTGTVYGVRIYDDIRTSEEMVDSTHGVVSDTSDPNLVGNWVADPDGPGFTDQSANAYDMQMSGDVTQSWSAGNDTLLGGDGADTIYGGGGDDLIEGGDGDDVLRTGLGDDTVYGGAGHDTITNSDGDDSLDGGSGDDSIVATGGEDTLRGGTGDDTMKGGEDADTFIIEDDFGNDVITGGEGTTDSTDVDYDTIDLSALSGAVTLTWTGDEAGTITDGVHTITFSEIEAVIATEQDDLIDASDDTAGVDIDAGGGNDKIVGGGGDDTIDGGAGNDAILGGGGDDTFVFEAGDGSDTILDFNFGNTGALGDGDTTNNDFVDLSGYYDNLTELRADFDDDGVLNQSAGGNYADNTQMQSGDGLTFQGAERSSFTSDNTGVVCFTAGTRIAVPSGEVPVEALRVGDLVVTRDNGPKPILWIGMRHLTLDELTAAPELLPVHIEPTLLGTDRPLIVSPQHAILLRDGPEERLVRAKHLAETPGRGARIAWGKRRVTYCHIMLDGHEIIFANDAPAESFFPGPQALDMLPRADLREVFALFPELSGAACDWATARAVSRRHQLAPSLHAFAPAL
ncbi:MAG: Hint domain-containing protein [Pseudomonadota bacterium]